MHKTDVNYLVHIELDNAQQTRSSKEILTIRNQQPPVFVCRGGVLKGKRGSHFFFFFFPF